MSDKLYEAFRIYLKEGLLGLNDAQKNQLLNSKGYDAQRISEAQDAYTLVTEDKILGPMIPELSSYDLNYINIKELYNAKRRKLGLESTPIESKPKEPVKEDNRVQNVADVSSTGNIQKEESNREYVDDIKKIKEKINNTQLVMAPKSDNMVNTDVPEGSTLAAEITPSVPISNNIKKTKTLVFNNPDVPASKPNYGYANIVLMSIIVMIIIAIICVFIFVK